MGRGLQERPPGSLEKPQPSACLAALHAAPTRLAGGAGGRFVEGTLATQDCL